MTKEPEVTTIDKDPVDATQKPRIVVGVDGSAPSLEALRFSLAEAERTGAEVHAIQVWEYPIYYGVPMALPIDDSPSGAALTELHDAVARIVADRRDRGEPNPPVVTSIVKGQPSMVLCEQAKGAQMLVVGSRGHGAIIGSLLGSVSHACVSHARCPVVVIPDPTAQLHHHGHLHRHSGVEQTSRGSSELASKG